MINELKEDISKLLKKEPKSFVYRYSNVFVLYLIYLKYLCDIDKYKYEDVIHNNEIYDLFDSISRIKEIIEKPVLINNLLRNISVCNTNDLVNEFVNSYEQLMPIYDENQERIFDSNIHHNLIMGYINLTGYDITGKTTYIVQRDRDYEYFKILDEILNINNKYLKEEEIEFDKYNYICIYDNRPKYRFIKEDNEYSHIYDYVHKIENVILYTRYSKISNFKDGRRILRNLKTVILSDDKAILIFNKDVKETSIINCDKIKSIDKLKQIIENNRKQKDVLVKTSYDEIINNNSRIGFSLYELDKSEDIKDINKIVDENTRLLEDLNRINETVEEEINKLLNR